MRVVERPQIIYFCQLFLQALSVRSFLLSSRNLLQQRVTLCELFKQTRKVGPLLRSDLCRRRVLCRGAIAQGKDGAICACRTKVIFDQRINRVRRRLIRTKELPHRQR